MPFTVPPQEARVVVHSVAVDTSPYPVSPALTEPASLARRSPDGPQGGAS